MTENRERTPVDIVAFMKGRAELPDEELARYMGEHVAFSGDGTQILAHGPDLDAAVAQLEQRGIHFSEVVWSYIPEMSYLGGFLDLSGEDEWEGLGPPSQASCWSL
jgi:hypothetical protein